MKPEKIEHIPLDSIDPNPNNRRVGGFDPVKLKPFAETIMNVGVQQNAVVRPKGERYELVAGERRWRASRIAGKETLPCVVRDLDDATVLKIQTIENLQREDVHPLDEADGYSRLIEEGKYDVEHIAEELGKSLGYIYQRLKLRDLIPAVREFYIEGHITAGHALRIARLGPEQQADVMKELGAIEKHRREPPSIRELDDWIQTYILMKLSTASWKTDDETLISSIGSCVNCVKRTGSNPELFEDIGKEDHCTDRKCFAAKGAAVVARRRAELKDEKHLEVFDSYSNGQLPKGVLGHDDWQECKKKDPGAMHVLVVGGNNPGRVTWGKPSNSKVAVSVDPKLAAKEKAARAHEKKIKTAQESLLVEIYTSILEQAEMSLAQRKEPEEVLALRRLGLFEIWNRVGWDGQNWIAKLEDWGKPEVQPRSNSKSWDNHVRVLIAKMDAQKLDLFLFVCIFGPQSKTFNSCYYSIPRSYTAAAKILGINLEERIKAKLDETGLERKELLPPLPKYMQDEEEIPGYGVCRVCGCTDDDCQKCVEKTGKPCTWVDATHTLCSACVVPEKKAKDPKSKGKK